MKAIFYPATLDIEGLTVADAIVYSQTLYLSLWDTSDTFTKEGGFTVSTHSNLGAVQFGCSITESIYKDVNLSRRQYYNSKKKLFETGYFCTEGIVLVDGVTDSFFELKTTTGLNGLRLVIYSYLANKSAKYGWIDKYHYAIAMELGIDQRVFQRNLAELKEMGLIRTKSHNNQTLLQTI